jgi:hypothetical protein
MSTEARQEKRSMGMTKLKTRIAVGLVTAIGVGALGIAIASAGASTGHAADTTTTSSTTTTTLAPPVQGNGAHHVFFSVDTVQGGGGTIKLPADAACSMTNLFQRGDVVVFRMYGVHVSTGANLTNVTVKSAWVKVPGLPKLPLYYSNHPTKPVVAYWTAAWPVGKSYPLGVVNYTVTVVTNPIPGGGLSGPVPSEVGVFTQQSTPEVASMLTIEPGS